MAAIGTVFFGTLGRSGFVAAISRCLKIELGVAAVLFVLAYALPRRPRDTQPDAADHASPDGADRSDARPAQDRPAVPEPAGR